MTSTPPPATERDGDAEPPAHLDGPDADAEAMAREIVLRQLTVRARTRSELSTALARRHVPADVAERVLERMGEVGLVDDAAFAEGWVRSRQQRRHLSGRALREELRRKGVDSELVAEAVEQIDPEDEYSAARALAVKKLRTMSGLEPHVRRRRLAGALARKGFSSALVMQVLNEEGLDDRD